MVEEKDKVATQPYEAKNPKARCETHQPRGQDHTVTEQQEDEQVEDTMPRQMLHGDCA
jgi:hypothetical protein